MHTQAVHLLGTSTLDLHDLEVGGDVPDMDEGDLSELMTPLHGNADTVEQGEDHVVQMLAAVEASVRVLPDAVDGPHSLRLSKDILEGDLQVVVDVVGIAVDKVEISHGWT